VKIRASQINVNLTLAVVAINGWNRIAIGFALQHPVATATTAAA